MCKKLKQIENKVLKSKPNSGTVKAETFEIN